MDFGVSLSNFLCFDEDLNSESLFLTEIFK